MFRLCQRCAWYHPNDVEFFSACVGVGLPTIDHFCPAFQEAAPEAAATAMTLEEKAA